MKRLVVAMALVATVGIVGAPGAAAQPAQRGWIDVNLGVAVAAEKSYSVTNDLPLYGERARFQADYEFPTGANFDFGGGFLFSKAFGVGISFSGTAHKAPATVSATIPHPRFFNALATGTAETEDIQKAEGAVHLQGVFVIPTSDNIRFRLFAGPSYFRVTQDTIDDIRYNQVFSVFNSGNSVTITGSPFSESEATAWGFHLGGDFAVFFNRVVGIGGFARYSRAEVEQTDLGGLVVNNKAGGLQAGGGLRLRF